MKRFHTLEKSCPDGIPFSECKRLMKNKTKKTNKKYKKSKISNKKKKRTVKRKHIPPKGVVIRKNDKLYRSNGKSLKPI